jgi:hypothetical protein
MPRCVQRQGLRFLSGSRQDRSQRLKRRAPKRVGPLGGTSGPRVGRRSVRRGEVLLPARASGGSGWHLEGQVRENWSCLRKEPNFSRNFILASFSS